MRKHFLFSRATPPLVTALFLIASCQAPQTPPAVNGAGIQSFSDRITKEWVGVILRLQTPPLAALATLSPNGKLTLTRSQTEKLLAEQNRMERKLHALSPDIVVTFRYRNLYNGIAIVAPRSLLPQIETLPGISRSQLDVRVEPPSAEVRELSRRSLLAELNTPEKLIGANKAHERGLNGQGIRVGIIDTGIDYTHAMFGGPGTEEAFKANNPAQVAPGTFPTAKVVGGFDFAGTNPWSDPSKPPQPQPDANPIDEQGHGTHVAGIVAGRGNGTTTFDGVAPDALLYAIKVFGAKGGTPGSSLLAGLDYTLDPNGDLDLSDRLDVVNLSLGSGYGTIFEDDSEIFANAKRTNVVFVAAAGNDGPQPFVVGNPSAANDTILSVAATIDDRDLQWKFPNSRFLLPQGRLLDVRTYPALFGKPIEESAGIGGNLAYVGTASSDLTEEQKAATAGKVALIDRGEVSFLEKAQRVLAAGAIGFVIANNKPDEPPFGMSGTEGVTVPIPGIMVSYETGQQLRAAMAIGDVRVEFQAPTRTETPEVIDTITEFSSRGPRSLDALIKPEIAAPGDRIVSAAMGSGDKGIAESGTSMAAPMAAGAIALLRQAFPNDSTQNLRARLMGSAKVVNKSTGGREDVALQGAGRLQIVQALDATLLPFPQTLSLGIRPLGSRNFSVSVDLENRGERLLNLKAVPELKGGLTLVNNPWIIVPAHARRRVSLTFSLAADADEEEFDGYIRFVDSGNGEKTFATIPVLAVARRGSEIQQESVTSGSKQIRLRNESPTQAGDVLLFHLLGTSPRLPKPRLLGYGNPCDLRSVGYRVVEREAAEGTPEKTRVLQFASQIDKPLTNPIHCELSVRIDTNGDGKAEMELVGGRLGDYTGKEEQSEIWATMLFDAVKMRELAERFLAERIENPEKPVVESYEEAIMAVGEFKAYANSTIEILEVPLASVQDRGSQTHLLVAMQPTRAQFADDDFLGKGASAKESWLPFDFSTLKPLTGPEVLELKGGESLVLTDIAPGSIVYLPHNRGPKGLPFAIPSEQAISLLLK